MKPKINHCKWWTIVAIFITFLFSSCQKELEIKNNINTHLQKSVTENEDEIPYKEGTNTLLGENKKNPYTVANMNDAWQYLADNGYTTNSGAKVYASHYYVKFKPKSSDEYEELQKDTTVEFSDMPIESTVIQNGDYYHDPSLPDTIPTYQYAAVKVDYQFPKGIDYEIIDKLYIPEQDNNFNYENGGSEDLFVDRLLNRAYLQTGNYEDTIALDNAKSSHLKNYYPKGNIRVFDTRLQHYIGMEGVRIRARRWFTVVNSYTDFNGSYQINHSFKRPCNYSMWFGNPLFAVRHYLVSMTYWINGPKKKNEWNYDLNNGYQRFAGHVYRGAFRYYLKNNGGLVRPWNPLRRQVYIAKDANIDCSGVNWIVLPIIRIGRYRQNGTEYNSDEILSSTCHETAHTAHVMIMNWGVIQYWQVTSQLQESWAVAVEWYLTHIEYAERGISNYGNWDYYPSNPPQYPNNLAYQYWNSDRNSNKYTSLYINLIDDYNENNKILLNGYIGTIDDQVSGYTLPFIESNILKHAYGLTSLANELKSHKPSGSSITDAQIDLLLSFY